MKKNYQYTLALLAIVVLSFGFYSCSSDESILLEVSTNELMFEEFGGELTIEVTTDYDGELEVTTNADWLTAKPVIGTGKWELSAQKNSIDKDRQAVVQVKAGSRVEQVMVTQFKKELFWLPYYGDDTSLSVVKAYEARRNSVIDYEEDRWIDFELNDPDEVWDLVEYKYLRGSKGVEGDYALSIIYTEKKELFDDRKAFDSFLTRRGFEKVGTDHYRHNKYDYDVSIDDTDYDSISVVLTYRPKQPKDYPTFSKLPIYPQYNHLTHVGQPWSWTDVQEYEAGMNDGAEYFDYDDYHVYAVFGDPHFYSREYEISKNSSSKLDSFGYATSDLDKVFFEHEGEYYMTDEMFALLDKAGFTFISVINGTLYDQDEYVFSDRNNPHSLLYVSRFIDDELMKGVQLAYFGTD